MQRPIHLLATSLFALLMVPALAQTQGQSASAIEPQKINVSCTDATQPVDERGFVQIGGIQQWVTIKGRSCANPVVLILHGGPGNTLSPFADTIYGAWEKDFTVVQWDQRGAGMTYGKNRPTEDTPLSVDQMSEDGIALTSYLTKHLGKKKVILMGGSWSSILGVHMIKSRPELFFAYVGSSHMVRYTDNQQATYTTVLSLARAAGDKETVAKIEALGSPPWTSPRSSGILRRAVRKYEALSIDPAPESWWIPAPEYATKKALADYDEGEEYSFLQFVGLKGDGMYSRVDLPKFATSFNIPFFVVQGSEDLLTMPAITRRYFDSITAPQKEFVLVPRAGHDPNQAMVDAQLKILKERVRPMTN